MTTDHFVNSCFLADIETDMKDFLQLFGKHLEMKYFLAI